MDRENGSVLAGWLGCCSSGCEGIRSDSFCTYLNCLAFCFGSVCFGRSAIVHHHIFRRGPVGCRHCH
ncbi:hypothetical protein Hanom_Chr17g01534191 [Helianthus anomalus]